MERDDCRAKYWLAPVRLHDSAGFRAPELRQIESLVAGRADELRKASDDHFTELGPVLAQDVRVTRDALIVDLVDGRSLTVPLAWYPRLAHGTKAERNNWRLIGRGDGIHWPELDEDIAVEDLVAGRRSGETDASLRRWLEARKAAG